MKLALRDAGLTIADVDYINAHATSTPMGDISETIAINRLKADLQTKFKISATVYDRVICWVAPVASKLLRRSWPSIRELFRLP